jgi:hypothetical protein
MNKVFIIALPIVIIFLFLLNNWLAKKPKRASKGGAWTVYGTDGCGWTRKQLKELDDKGVQYTYVNCENEDCGGLTAFPTLKGPDGTTKVGFTTF